jgi:mRNA interferase MazF
MVKANTYLPTRGDIVWLSFDPAEGHEQKGRRPALVLTAKRYNETVGLMLVCPITAKVKGYLFEVGLQGRKARGVVQVDHIKSCDFRSRKVSFIERAPAKVVEEVTKRLLVLFSTNDS